MSTNCRCCFKHDRCKTMSAFTHVVDLSSSTPRIPGISAVGSGISKRESWALFGVCKTLASRLDSRWSHKRVFSELGGALFWDPYTWILVFRITPISAHHVSYWLHRQQKLNPHFFPLLGGVVLMRGNPQKEHGTLQSFLAL